MTQDKADSAALKRADPVYKPVAELGRIVPDVNLNSPHPLASNVTQRTTCMDWNIPKGGSVAALDPECPPGVGATSYHHAGSNVAGIDVEGGLDGVIELDRREMPAWYQLTD